jgi:hypothetical protein
MVFFNVFNVVSYIFSLFLKGFGAQEVMATAKIK